MLTLYTAPPLWGIPSISPHCLELETWLRLAKLPYHKTTEHLEQAPKGKVPFVQYGDRYIGDATFIIEYLKQAEGIDLDAALTAPERGISLALRRMLKENTYWGLVYLRYGPEENWQRYRAMIAGALMPQLTEQEWLPQLEALRERILAQLHGQGMGRHSPSEICQLTCADFQALSDVLASQSFFISDCPTTLDATAYAYVANVIHAPFDGEMVAYVRELKNLIDHCDRITQQCFTSLENSREHDQKPG
ncbi:glutathione S-transferase family protein [Acaryochloris sp. IP29b_bin.148]|uniref:glutathione S-transferase family protein n=1 Tax=Acaryochloris sp. IP29b_bin.148 TaxID=2969218 RepID=UPI00262C9B6B|nr:glutathione S-transferase family protein [Acaryochloris sp. IP29b_bin.148]